MCLKCVKDLDNAVDLNFWKFLIIHVNKMNKTSENMKVLQSDISKDSYANFDESDLSQEEKQTKEIYFHSVLNAVNKLYLLYKITMTQTFFPFLSYW